MGAAGRGALGARSLAVVREPFKLDVTAAVYDLFYLDSRRVVVRVPGVADRGVLGAGVLAVARDPFNVDATATAHHTLHLDSR